jgi:hypothetical protein
MRIISGVRMVNLAFPTTTRALGSARGFVAISPAACGMAVGDAVASDEFCGSCPETARVDPNTSPIAAKWSRKVLTDFLLLLFVQPKRITAECDADMTGRRC